MNLRFTFNLMRNASSFLGPKIQTKTFKNCFNMSNNILKLRDLYFFNK